MMRVASLVLALVLPLSVLAQRLSHPVMVLRDEAFSSPAASLAGPDTVRVLALMVQFQQDKDARTTGDGQFDLTTTSSPVLDSPPHNAAYFRSHLLFLENYYSTVSKGKLIVLTRLLDQVVTLPTTMGTYSPGRGTSNLPVANLAVDSWHAADSLHLVPDFSAYDAFVVLHAGVGRDLDLAGEIGYDPTPLDIPSLFFGLNAFKSFYGQDYQGIPVSGGAFHITNTLIIPETETRTLPTATGDALYSLSTNGLLCASLGNYLGLPDLFNTATGASGIGRFGLMDGQAIFSYSGAFPPEPSAWEKYWLGWITPIVVPPGATTLTLPAVALEDSVYRIPINATEYFLVENRNRDAKRTGQTVTSVYNGVTKKQTFMRDTTGFNAYDISALSGVVTQVTSYDWSLPGALDEDGTWYDGGLLIWHIDETVIAQTIGSDAVNANPARPGVNVKEADGSQDIGQSYGFLSPGSGSEAGTPLDYWFKGNLAPVYKNEFSPTSYPNSNSNTGANSHITVHSVSARGPRMTAVVERGDASVMALIGFPKSLGQQLPPQAVAVGAGNAPELFVATLDSTTRGAQTIDSTVTVLPAKLYAWTSNGTPALAGGAQSGVIASAPLHENFFPGLAVGDLNSDGISECVLPSREAPATTGRMEAFSLRDVSPVDSLADRWFDIAVPRTVSTPPLIADSMIVFGDAAGKVSFAALNGTLFLSVESGHDSLSSVAGMSRFGSGSFAVTNKSGILNLISPAGVGNPAAARTFMNFGHEIVGPPAAGDFHGAKALAFATSDGLLYLVDGSFNVFPGFPVNTGASIVAPPALADIDGDGSRDIVLCSGSLICAYSYLGVSLDHFPVTVKAGKPLASNPIVADIDGDGTADVVGVAGDGVVAAVDRNGKMVRGFPLAAGAGNQSVAAFAVPGGKIGLVVASSGDGTVNAWTTGTAGASWVNPWPQYQKDARHSGFDGSSLTPGAPVTQEFFPANRSYNWPNPVHEGVTHIRYYIRENATVRVKIFDFAGDLVTEIAGSGMGGMDNEVDWNVGNVQSGIYFARIEANGAGGSGVNIVKVAVVK
jgi:hypothetical protein